MEKIIVGGKSGANEFAVARYLTNGTLDVSFDGDGKTTVGFSASDVARAVAVQTDGKILAAGSNSSSQFVLARFNSADGSLDTSFDNDGKVITDVSDGEQARVVALQSDGKIVIAGPASFNGLDHFAVVRYKVDGSLDTSFSSDGIAFTSIGVDTGVFGDMVLTSDSKILLSGTTYDNLDADILEYVFARFNNDGTLDTSFSNDGVKPTGIEDGNFVGRFFVTLQPNNKIVAFEDNHGDFQYHRFNTDGSVDTTFDSDGQYIAATPGTEFASDIILTPSGKICACGMNGNTRFIASCVWQ